MTSLVEALAHREIGVVEQVSASRISVLLHPEAPQATALNAGAPAGFPRINGYVLIRAESGATACIVSGMQIDRRPFPKRAGTQRDYHLVDLPFPSRVLSTTPIGTLKAEPGEDGLVVRVRRGVDVFPSVGDPVHLPTEDQLRAIVQGEDDEAGRILLGRCPTAAMAPVHVDPDKLFGRHLAVLGNTGAGKSCTVAGLVRWSLEAARKERNARNGSGCPLNARFIVLDPNGEYARAFRELGARVFRVDPGQGEPPLKVPAWLWNGEEWAAFTQASPGVQRPLLFEALRRLRSGLGSPDRFEALAKARIRRYRNRLKVLVANSEHQQPGKREGVAGVLDNMRTDFQDLVQGLESPDGDFKAALEAVSSRASDLEVSSRTGRKKPPKTGYWHTDFSEAELDQVNDALARAAKLVGLEDEDNQALADVDAPIPFPVSELPDYVDALAADQAGRDIGQFVDTLKLRIQGMLSGGRLAEVIHSDCDERPAVCLGRWLEDFLGGASDSKTTGHLTVLDLSLVPSEVTHVVVAVLARMVFEALQRYRRRNQSELPTALILDEAHMFLHRDLPGETSTPAGRACVRVFERIAREGRKFGLGLVLASQRPSEVSPTVLSQCNTFLLHRLVNDRDQELVRRLVPDGLGTLLRELPSLPTRRAILLGWAAPAPTLVEVSRIPPRQRPNSSDPPFWKVWTGAEQRQVDWSEVAREWVQRPSVSKPTAGAGGPADKPSID